MSVRNLSPVIIWNHFEDLNQIPRPSKKEDRVITFMMEFGENLGLETLKDKVGNVIIKKPGTEGMDEYPTVILQSHLDMVHQKNNATKFDFDQEGIRSYIDGDWVKADGTTLGADNGMGVAAAMSILSSKNIPHPPIEALFTIDEETGMTGAKQLDGKLLSGKILLNLDTEDDDEFSVGCAGGRDTNTSYLYSQEDVPDNYIGIKIEISGLKGGHSGMDIHLGRGNANKWMNRVIYEINRRIDLRIVEIDGGSLRNAIPRESNGIFVVDQSLIKELDAEFASIRATLLSEYSIVESSAEIKLKTITDQPSKMMSKNDQKKVVSAIYTCPNGVWKMSEKMEGIVETSSSLARVEISNGEFTSQSLQRSMIESGKEDITTAVRLNFEQMGAKVVQNGDYPGWAPNPESPILKVLLEQYRGLFKEEPKVAACHAGLECGILSKHLPGCDMISFGPTIKNPHSPDEMVNIKSVEKFWHFLTSILANIRP